MPGPPLDGNTLLHYLYPQVGNYPRGLSVTSY